MGYYDIAQICLNGHVINSALEQSPQLGQKRCQHCGEETISSCRNCNTPIRGWYHIADMWEVGPAFSIPAYCHECGAPYPWTDAQLQAAKELIDLVPIPTEEKESVKADLANLLTDTPRTKLAATKMGLFLKKAGTEVATALRDILVDIVSEAAKKQLFPGP